MTLTPIFEKIVEFTCSTVIFTLLVGLPTIYTPNLIPKYWLFSHLNDDMMILCCDIFM